MISLSSAAVIGFPKFRNFGGIVIFQILFESPQYLDSLKPGIPEIKYIHSFPDL